MNPHIDAVFYFSFYPAGEYQAIICTQLIFQWTSVEVTAVAKRGNLRRGYEFSVVYGSKQPKTLTHKHKHTGSNWWFICPVHTRIAWHYNVSHMVHYSLLFKCMRNIFVHNPCWASTRSQIWNVNDVLLWYNVNNMLLLHNLTIKHQYYKWSSRFILTQHWIRLPNCWV